MDASSELVPSHVALIGLMGVGKTTIGRIVARRLDRAFLDNDGLVADLGRPDVATVTARDGEAAMRALESRVLRLQLSAPEPTVLPIAAGTVLAADNRALLAEKAVVVWLDAPVELLAERIRASSQGRPFVGPDLEATLAAQRRERAVWYAGLADVVVDVAGRSPEANADLVLAGLAERRRRPRTAS